MSKNILSAPIIIAFSAFFIFASCSTKESPKTGELMYDHTYKNDSFTIHLLKKFGYPYIDFDFQCQLPSYEKQLNDSSGMYHSLLKLSLFDRQGKLVGFATDSLDYKSLNRIKESGENNGTVRHQLQVTDGFVNEQNYAVKFEAKAYYIGYKEDSLPGNRIRVTRFISTEPYLEIDFDVVLNP